MYIVKSIVEELGGEIKVKSKLNNGTTFIVRLRPVI
ncbi:MAG: ATP-binding protein [Anaerolineales bacterium]|nr:ATP-binding protein [Anaerolineales bacterium]